MNAAPHGERHPILWALSGVRLADLTLGGDIGRIRRFNGRFETPVTPNATPRLVVWGDGPVLGWRLEDPRTRTVHVTGEAACAVVRNFGVPADCRAQTARTVGRQVTR